MVKPLSHILRVSNSAELFHFFFFPSILSVSAFFDEVSAFAGFSFVCNYEQFRSDHLFFLPKVHRNIPTHDRDPRGYGQEERAASRRTCPSRTFHRLHWTRFSIWRSNRCVIPPLVTHIDV